MSDLRNPKIFIVDDRIIEEHQGKIELESIADEGTTFKVILPVGD